MLSSEEKPKAKNAILIALGNPKPDASESEESYDGEDDEEGDELAGQALLDALEAKDAKAVGAALKAAVKACM